MSLTVEIIRSSGGWEALEPASARSGAGETLYGAIEAAARSAFASAAASGASAFDSATPGEMSVVLASDEFVRELNRQFRGQDKPTNVLSFPAEPFPLEELAGEPVPLGDVIAAWETLLREAGDEGKEPLDHLRHLVVHGTLHLLGFDHQDDDEAEQMETLEREALARLGVTDPYFGVADPYRETAEQAGTTGGASSRGMNDE
jgi:probable rRNA maturation factor